MTLGWFPTNKQFFINCNSRYSNAGSRQVKAFAFTVLNNVLFPKITENKPRGGSLGYNFPRFSSQWEEHGKKGTQGCLCL